LKEKSVPLAQSSIAIIGARAWTGRVAVLAISPEPRVRIVLRIIMAISVTNIVIQPHAVWVAAPVPARVNVLLVFL
jgi:hypothetical protein